MECHRAPSIEQYVSFILSDKRVINALTQISHSNAMGEYFLALPLDKLDPAERLYASRYLKALNHAKERSIRDILINSMPQRWLYLNNLEDIAHNVIAGEPSYEDLPLILLWHLAQDSQFMPYLVSGQLPWFGTLPTERTQEFVFALFLWLRMEARYDAATGRAYYVNANDKTVKDRERFIELFKGYIHSDLWQAEDYERRGKEGLVIRLRFSVAATGQVVVQECGEKTGNCNKLYLITKESIRKLEEDYLKAKRLLFFQCHYCANSGACLFITLDKETRFYCNDLCYNKSIK